MDDAQAVALIAMVASVIDQGFQQLNPVKDYVIVDHPSTLVERARELLDESRRQLVEARRTEERMGKCSVCDGTGRNPGSDITNWLSCSSCNGTGVRPEYVAVGEG